MARGLCPAGELLYSWLEQHDISPADFAELMGCDRSTLYRNATAERAISIDNAAFIENVTGIPARMWASSEHLRSGTEAAA
jgi:plasmid maintenance system antidote protein VapI